MVIAVIEVIGYRHVLAPTDAPEVAVVAHLPHQLLDIVVGFAEGLAHLLRTRRFTQRAKALLDLLPLTGVAILLRIPGDLPGGGGGVPREGKLLLLLYVPPRDVEIGVGPTPLAVQDQCPICAAGKAHGARYLVEGVLGTELAQVVDDQDGHVVVGRKLDEGLDRLVVLLVEVLTALTGAELREGVDHHESGIRVSVEPGFLGHQGLHLRAWATRWRARGLQEQCRLAGASSAGIEPSGIVLKGQVEDRTPFNPFRAEGDATRRNRQRRAQSEPALTHLRFARQDSGALGYDPRHDPTRLRELDGHKLRGTHRILQDPRDPGCLGTISFTAAWASSPASSVGS